MTDISEHLPKESQTVAAIYAAYKKAGDAEPIRGYLGASIIGHHCERYLWYCFRQCCKPEFDGRMYRLFATGDLEEARFVKDLRDIGCEVHDTNQSKQDPRGWPEQFAVSALGGHFSGHMDGCALGIPEAPKTWHVGEFKTHNAKSFAKLKKEGVYESKPQHYAQMQVYMHLTGMKRALYLARNKDTDELYSERVHYHEADAMELMWRAERIITATAPPDRISRRRDYYQCKWCDAKGICWGTESFGSALSVPSLSCRQCCHATPIIDKSPHPIVKIDASWRCEKRGDYFAGEGIPCTLHLILPGLLEAFTESMDYDGHGTIEFTNKDGTTWKHGAGGYSSQELMKLPVSALGNRMIQTAKDLFDATITGCEEDILKRYPEEDSRTIWKGPAAYLIEAWKTKYNEEDLTKLKPIAWFHNLPEYDVAELEGDRIAIMWENGTAEIREGVE